ncbi:NPCBM/NEW2 domain-containing protein [Posidoniimonas polymericola]|uniref:NPCBM/NEW2 domain-containing protein n=1 Tax=Posidoniimonas polymericola TaxID=2528002 RepID=UPI0011B6ED30|nr:NPCBM/NEW2 domain-containing protein [Posidoniimonas polymericola]
MKRTRRTSRGAGRAVALLAAVVATPYAAFAQEDTPLPSGELLRLGQPAVEAMFSTLSENAVEFLVEGKPRRVAADELVRWGAPAERGPLPTALLADGSVIACGPAWARGGAVQLADGEWLLRNTQLNAVTLDKPAVQAVWFAAASGPDVHRVRAESAAYRGAEDQVWLDSGDALAGELVSIDKTSVGFKVAGEDTPIEVARVAAVAVGGARDANRSEGRLLVGLDDGTLLSVTHIEQLPHRTNLRLGVGEEFAAKRDLGVRFLQASGERVQYLNGLAPLDFRHTPYLSVGWPLDRDPAGPTGEFEAGGRRFHNGLAMHSASRAVYRLDGEWRRFAAELALEDRGAEGSVTFHVLVARDQGFASEYDSPVIRTGDPPTPVAIDLQGARAIALLVDYADYADRGDHAVWIDARLEK